jgi:hypothetical protein
MSLPGVHVKMEISIESSWGVTVAESSTATFSCADTGNHASMKKTNKKICLTSVTIFATAKVQKNQGVFYKKITFLE